MFRLSLMVIQCRVFNSLVYAILFSNYYKQSFFNNYYKAKLYERNRLSDYFTHW